MDISVFTDKANIPTPEELQKAIGSTLHLWLDIADYAHKKHPKSNRRVELFRQKLRMEL